jgi:hypothetical protein
VAQAAPGANPDGTRRPTIPEASPGDAVFDEILGRDLPPPRAREQAVEAFERRYIERVLDRYGGNVVRAEGGVGDRAELFPDPEGPLQGRVTCAVTAFSS